MVSNQSLNAFTASTELAALSENEIAQYEVQTGAQAINIEDFMSENGELDMAALLLIDTGGIPVLDILSDYYYQTSEEIIRLRAEINEMTDQRKSIEEEENAIHIKTLSLEIETAAVEKEIKSLKQNSYLKKAIATTIENVDRLKEQVNQLGSELLPDDDYIVSNNLIYNLFPKVIRHGSLGNLNMKSEDIFHLGRGQCDNRYSEDDIVSTNICNSYKHNIPGVGEIFNYLQGEEHRGYFTLSSSSGLSAEQNGVNNGIKGDDFVQRNNKYVLIETALPETDDSDEI